MNNRQKGLALVRDVKHILEQTGHTVEGPGYKSLFIKGKIVAVHSDFFGCFDLLSAGKDTMIYGHQVCSAENKTRNAKKIFDAGFNGDLWCYDGPRKGFSRYWVHEDNGQMHIEELGTGIKL
jgi:hypothetical protein